MSRTSPPHYLRRLPLQSLIEKKSFFLFGARQVGKSTLIQTAWPQNTTAPESLQNVSIDKTSTQEPDTPELSTQKLSAQEAAQSVALYDLLDAEVYAKLLRRPKLLAEENPDPNTIIIIDEVQMLPPLLNEVHRLIEKQGRRFLLTGSSARKLKARSTNRLAGRAWQALLLPLSWSEIPDFSLLRYLNHGGLPAIYNSSEPYEDLTAYVNTYLKNEIQNEALVRQVQAFAEFLDLMALSNGQEISFGSFASDLQVSPNTLKNYIEILNDTLLGFYLPGFCKTKKRKATSRAKYYFFDIGVVNALCNRHLIAEQSELFGTAFEHFIILEMRAFLSYTRRCQKMYYWRTGANEVDLIVENELAIEIKSTTLVQDKHLKSLRLFKQEGLVKKHIVVSRDTSLRTTKDGIQIYPWATFLKQLWDGKLF